MAPELQCEEGAGVLRCGLTPRDKGISTQTLWDLHILLKLGSKNPEVGNPYSLTQLLEGPDPYPAVPTCRVRTS